MTNTTHTSLTARIARYIAVPLFLAGAALGMAGMASAATYSQPADPGFNAPSVKAHPAPSATPGSYYHGMHHIEALIKEGFRP
jgi:hypothetical protein